ncbi:unnamed protein product [Prorocentrum cordatum]|uniref:RNase H type-1 domain-containing protein n=1 Tax=Prorocentrum cordatum TaxID=2364126 RepID=A0ABN9W2F6_9DINO|nr:unnamed protein product [Polarella glacialis]
MGRGGSGRGAGSAWWRYCRNITSNGDLCICGSSLGSLVPEGHVYKDDEGGGDKAGQRDHTVSLQAAAAAAYNKLSKDDPLRAHYEALWLDKLQKKKVRAAGEQVESAKQYLVESERKLHDAMAASIVAEEEFDTLKAQVGKPEVPAAKQPGAEKTALASLLEQFEKEPDDFHKWAEPDKGTWRAAKAKGEAMAQKVKEHEAETAKHLRYLEEETANHQEQLRQLEQARTKRQTEAQASKKKARRQFNVDFLNITTWGPQAQDYFKEIRSTKDRNIIGIAEHHLRQPVQISRARAACDGMACAATGLEHGQEKVRFAVAFLYLECGKGLSDRNVNILCDLREKMAVWGGPWAAMGDFNIAPSELNDSIWPRVLNGQVVAAEGCEEAENDMEPVPQLYYDKEVQHVVTDEFWHAAAEQVRAKVREELPPRLTGTVISKLMEQDMLELGQQYDLFAGTLELSLCESIGIPADKRGKHMGHGRPPTFKSVSTKDGEANHQQIPDDQDSIGHHLADRRGRSTMDMDDYDPFQDEEDSEDGHQQPAGKQDGEDTHQHNPDDQDSIGHHLQWENADEDNGDCRQHSTDKQDGEDYHQQIPDQQDSIKGHQGDLERWAAIWMDGLSQVPADNTNWMEWCPPFLEVVFSNGGNIGLERLLRHNEEGEAKEHQQILLATLGMIAEGALVDPATSHQVAEGVRSAANNLTKAAKKAYIHWVHDATAGSAKLAHAYTKAAERSHIEDTLGHEGQVISHPQQLVDLRKGAWQRRWTRDAHKSDQIQDALGKLRTAALAQDSAPEPLSKDIVGSIIQHLKRNAGQGADWWRAPELKAMGAQGLTEFVQCLRNCEERAAWPWQFYLVLELLLGKKPGIGGERPIGLMPMPYRIWSAARRPIIATWSKEAAGFWDTAVAGSSALRVAMHRLMRAEAAVQMGFHAAGIFYDAANFYDNLGLDQLIEKAGDLNYPLLPLAMAVQMYLAPEAIMAHSLFSDIFEPANSMVAGCGQAVDLTRPLLYGIMDAAYRHHIYVVIQQYLDDLALHIEGARKRVIYHVKYVAALVHQGFARLSIPISIKTAVAASDKDLQQEIASILDGLGTPNKQPGVVRDLGVDTGLGKQLKRPTHAARQAKAKQRVAKLKDLAKTGARGAAKVYAAGAYCQQAWDLPAHGITSTEATKFRATEAALLTGGHKAGRCTSTILLIQRGAHEAVTRAIVDQVKQFWLTIVDHPTELKRYQRGWHMLYDKLQAQEPNRRWNQVKGPMAGVIVQLLGLGWNPRRPDSWTSPAGDEWAYRPEDIPHFGALLQEVQLSAQLQLWQKAAEHRHGAGLQEGGDLYQLHRHLRRRRRKGQHAEAAMLETIAVAGIWTRERRRAANLNQVDPDEDVEKAAHIFCTNAEAQAAAQAGHKVQADYIFTDGSGGAGATAKDPRLRRCGWAAVAFRYDRDGLPQEVAAWYGTIRAPHAVPSAELTAISKAIGYTTAASARGLNIVSDCKCALDALKQIQDPEGLDYRSTNFDLWLMAKRQLQNSTDHIMGHHIPSHMIEHPKHGTLGPAIIAQQQITDQITVAVQNRLLGISMAVMVEDPNKHQNVRLDFKTVQIGTQVVHDTHKTQLTQGWPRCEKCGATSYLGNHKGRIVAGVARKLAKPCVPPTTVGRRVITDLQKGRLPRRAKQDEGLAAAAPPVEVTTVGFNPGASSAEVIDLDGESSEAETPQPAQPQPPRQPHPVAQASWQLVDHMEGYAEQWMNMVDQGVWEDKGDWMEHGVPYLLAVTNAGGRADVQDQRRAVTPMEIQQIIDFCEDIWKNTHRAQRRLMTHMLTLPHGSRQQAARVHMEACQGRRKTILTHSIPSSERRPLPSTADDYRARTPEYQDDNSTQPDSEVPELEGHDSDRDMDTINATGQLNDATTCDKTSATFQGTPWFAKPTGPDPMKHVREAKDAGTQHLRLRQQRGHEDQDPEQELAWLKRHRMEQPMQSLAGG